MSFQLTFGGGEVVLVRDTGTANAVQGFVTDEITLGANDIALPSNFIFQLYSYIQAPLIVFAGSKFWIKISGTWREAITWINVSGVWKQATPFVKDVGIWK
jgi:hypothetical protein